MNCTVSVKAPNSVDKTGTFQQNIIRSGLKCVWGFFKKWSSSGQKKKKKTTASHQCSQSTKTCLVSDVCCFIPLPPSRSTNANRSPSHSKPVLKSHPCSLVTSHRRGLGHNVTSCYLETWTKLLYNGMLLVTMNNFASLVSPHEVKKDVWGGHTLTPRTPRTCSGVWIFLVFF